MVWGFGCAKTGRLARTLRQATFAAAQGNAARVASLSRLRLWSFKEDADKTPGTASVAPGLTLAPWRLARAARLPSSCGPQRPRPHQPCALLLRLRPAPQQQPWRRQPQPGRRRRRRPHPPGSRQPGWRRRRRWPQSGPHHRPVQRPPWPGRRPAPPCPAPFASRPIVTSSGPRPQKGSWGSWEFHSGCSVYRQLQRPMSLAVPGRPISTTERQDPHRTHDASAGSRPARVWIYAARSAPPTSAAASSKARTIEGLNA